MTPQLLRDIGAMDLTEALRYANNVEQELVDGNLNFEFFDRFQMRGQVATVARNYFQWRLSTDIYNIERIEESRGPNSILFGIASTGGILSTSTKQAYTGADFRRATLVAGGLGLRRATVDVNQSSWDKRLGIRVNAVASEEDSFRHHAFQHEYRGHVAAKFEASPRTTIGVEYEKGHTRQNVADNQGVGDAISGWIAAGRPMANGAAALPGFVRVEGRQLVFDDNSRRLVDVAGTAVIRPPGSSLLRDPRLADDAANVGGPGQVRQARFNAFGANLEHRLGRRSFLQFGYNHQDYDFEAYQAFNVSPLSVDANPSIGGASNPHAGHLYFEAPWSRRVRTETLDNVRVMASTEWDLGRLGAYRAAAPAEHEQRREFKKGTIEIWEGRPFAAAAEAPANQVRRRHYVTEGISPPITLADTTRRKTSRP